MKAQVSGNGICAALLLQQHPSLLTLDRSRSAVDRRRTACPRAFKLASTGRTHFICPDCWRLQRTSKPGAATCTPRANYRLAGNVVDRLISNVSAVRRKVSSSRRWDQSIWAGRLAYNSTIKLPSRLEQIMRAELSILRWHSERDHLALELARPPQTRVSLLQSSLMLRTGDRAEVRSSEIWETEARDRDSRFR